MKPSQALYHRMGAHLTESGRARFRVYAPHAKRVCLTGDPFDWGQGVEMKREEDGCFAVELAAGSIAVGDHYGYRVESDRGWVLKNDPFAFLSQPHSYGASRFYPLSSTYPWQDEGYLRRRRARLGRAARENYPIPINIYEVHLGSFREDCPSYRTAADFLAPYLADMGYTHVELLPLGEHPYGGSWGYQCLSYFAPTARYGLPEDLAYFVDRMHASGIGVILDFVPAHFPKDEKGLIDFDGGPLYEYADPLMAEMPGWGTRCFDLASPYVCDFLISSALFYLTRFHLDGLRVDAVSAMLYRDYGRPSDGFRPEVDGSHINRAGVRFLERLTQSVRALGADLMLFAEESSAWDGVTRGVEEGGLGFSFKWNLGWANDSFYYLGKDPVYRRYHHDRLTFPLVYAFHERHLLPISHDEVVYGKRSLFCKAEGDDRFRAATFRTFYAFFMTSPGKKLLFMGSELAQRNEWNWQGKVEFSLLSEPMHAELRDYVRAMNRFYLSSPPLYECDFGWEGFTWQSVDDRDGNLIAYERRDRAGRTLLCIFCFAGGGKRELRLPCLASGRWRIVFSSGVGPHTLLSGGMLLQPPFAILAEPQKPKTDPSKEESPS